MAVTVALEQVSSAREPPQAAAMEQRMAQLAGAMDGSYHSSSPHVPQILSPGMPQGAIDESGMTLSGRSYQVHHTQHAQVLTPGRPELEPSSNQAPPSQQFLGSARSFSSIGSTSP